VVKVIKMGQVSGIHAVLYALFDEAGRLDEQAMRAQVRHVMACNVDGVTVLGLATEVSKLTPEEQRNVVVWVSDELAGRAPLSVTISGNSVAVQRDFVRFSLDHGADWLILQPPSAGSYPGDVYLKYFLDVADGFETTFSIQNAPAYLGRALSNADVTRLTTSNPNFGAIKAETSAVDLAGLISRCGTDLDVLNGRGGLEMTDCLRAGASGFVLAPDVIDFSKRIFDLWHSGETEAAEQLHSDVLPAIVFMMQSIEHLICYGKRIYGARTGTVIFDRSPAIEPTNFGARLVENWARRLDELGADERTS
jgi:4-hydroxy-tetrahydrodipicolinate synthase